MALPDGSNPRLTDEKLELIIGDLLRGGVIVAAAVVLIGGIVFLVQHSRDAVSYASFHLERHDLRSVSGIFGAAIRLQPDAIIQLGLVLLIATPIARVALAAVGFALERDYMYVVVSLIVLSILLFSITHAV